MIFDIFYMKYRGYLKDSEKWIYGYHILDGGKNYIAEEDPLEVIRLNPETSLAKFVKVDSMSLGLCSLTKDVNGVDVYTGDVLETTVGDESPFNEIKQGLVYFDRYGFYCEGVGIDFGVDDFQFCKVVGNIYNNPELTPEWPDDFTEE